MNAVAAALLKKGLTLLGGAVLQKGVDVVEGKLGVKLPTSPAEVEAQLPVLRSAEAANEQQLLEWASAYQAAELESARLALGNTLDARHMEIEAQRGEHTSVLARNIAPILALIVVLGGFALLAFSKDIEIKAIVPSLITLVLGFYFGTSDSSKGKNNVIAKLAQRGQQ